MAVLASLLPMAPPLTPLSPIGWYPSCMVISASRPTLPSGPSLKTNTDADAARPPCEPATGAISFPFSRPPTLTAPLLPSVPLPLPLPLPVLEPSGMELP
jgi:hypothetical protein